MYGFAVLVAAIVGFFMSERLWVKGLCAALVALAILVHVFSGGGPSLDRLMIPGLLLAFAAFVRMVVKGYGKY